jgi:hypothetical protein
VDWRRTNHHGDDNENNDENNANELTELMLIVTKPISIWQMDATAGSLRLWRYLSLAIGANTYVIRAYIFGGGRESNRVSKRGT